MKVYRYNDEYAGKNGTNGVKELVAVLCIGVAGTLAPVLLMGLHTISWRLGLPIIAFTAAVCAVFLRRVCIIVRAGMSALIDGDDGELYYLTITPNLRGSSIPRSASAMLAGSSATYAENSVDAEINASNLAQNDEYVLQLFRLYQDDRIKTTFDTVMYGKPVTVCRLLDRDFRRKVQKVYRVSCIRNKKRHTSVWIPRAFPDFFE